MIFFYHPNQGAGVSLQYFKKAIPTNKDTWLPESFLLEHQHPYASSHHRQKSGGRNYVITALVNV
jgi:hypothetical protein